MADGLILVTGWPGQPSVQELEKQALADVRPRTDYVELARRLGSDVVDAAYMQERAAPVARSVARLGGLAHGQVVEALLRERRYRWVLAWADGLGFRLAALNQLARRHARLVVVSVRLATPKKRLLLRRFGLHKQFDAIVNYGSEQLARAAEYGVPESKLRLLLQPVDERFWRPAGLGEEGSVCAVGSEARDYRTLARAVEGAPVRVEIAVGSSVRGDARADGIDAATGGVANLAVHRALPHHRLRELYE